MTKGFIVAGGVLVALGVLLSVFPKALAWFGRLPGDVRTDAVFFPFTSMLVVSAVLTLLVNLLAWLFRGR